MTVRPLSELLQRADDTPITVGPQRLTRRDFAIAVQALAYPLRQYAGRQVGLHFQDAAALAVALFACWRAGATAVLPGDIAIKALDSLGCTTDCWLSDAPSGPAHVPDWRHVPVPQPQPGTALPHGQAPLLDPDAHGMILYTSGSSGHAKPIVKRWRQLEQEVAALAAQWPSTHDCPVVLGSVSPMHMYGLPFRVLWPLAAGRPFDPRQHLYPEVLEKATLPHRQAIWITSPALLRRLCGRLDWSQLKGKVVAVYSAGGELPPSAIAYLHTDSGLRPIEIYGSSETGIVAWRQGDTSWRPFNGVHVQLNAAGALHIQSAWTGALPEQTADTAEIHADGRFRLLGRLDRIVKIEERRIALSTVEACLATHAYVREAHVGKPDDHPRLAALITLTKLGLHALRQDGRRATLERLRQHLAQHCHTLAIPRRWRLLAELPWTAQGKLKRQDFLDACGPRPTQADVLEVTHRDAHEHRMMIRIPLDLACFSGHFPQVPVVPGVILIGWAVQWGQVLLAPGLRSQQLENLKFQRLIRPGDTLDVHLRWDNRTGKLHFQYALEGAPAASGRIVSNAPPGEPEATP